MHYTGQIYRPPLEAYTPLLEVTYGCSHNRCAFCTMYHRTRFGIAPLEDVEEDIIELSRTYLRPMKRVYLLNGDPFVLSADRLLRISDLLHQYIPELETITAYASFYNLKNKSKEELRTLRKAGYNELWFGVESGDPQVLAWLDKGADLADYHEGIEKMAFADMDYFAIVMQGIKGAGKSKENARATAKFLNAYPPIGVFIMSTDVQEGSKLYQMREAGQFVETSNRENLEEQIELLKHLDLPDQTLYSSGHMVNLVSISGHMDKKARMIEKLEKVLRELPESVLEEKNQGRAI